MSSKKKRNDGKKFEQQTRIFFSFLFKKLGYIVHKERIQFNGTQDGFDVQFVIADNFIERTIFIECKDYSTDLKFGNIYAKAHDLESNYNFSEKDVALFISPRANFGNKRNPEKAEPILSKFPFVIRLLELSNGIDRLFAIDKEIYKEIYKKDCILDIVEKDEINKFKSILLSRGSLKKIIVKEKDKLKYISNIESKKNYISRTITYTKHLEKAGHRFNILDFDDSDLIHSVKTLIDDDKIDGLVLLGNPGLGKSVELRELALHYWDHRDSEKWVPFYRSINNFTFNEYISDRLPKEWKYVKQMLFIFDGLDEISYANEFKSKLQNFILENKSENIKIKFVLSCRTNIYENVIKDISNFSTCFLNPIEYNKALDFLRSNFNLSMSSYANLMTGDNLKEFLENPYYLNLFGEYYAQNKKLPKNKCELIEKYVDSRLEDDRKIKYNKEHYDKPLIHTLCKKVGLTMEAMQINQIDESKLNSLIKENKIKFTNSCFIEKIFNEDKWKFEHRNLQEYFVAKALENLPKDNIVDFIRIDDSINKTHPSWLNSISYLINLNSNSSSKADLINWLQENDMDVLFKADSDRIPKEVRIKVFQDYFIKTCKEDTLWIRTYDSGVIELARFGDYIENVAFLIDEIEDPNNHRRTRLSAFDLLSNMSLSSKREDVKSLILKVLDYQNKEFDFSAKSEIIRFVKKVNFHKENSFISDVIKALGDIDYHRVTSAVFELIMDSKTADAHFEYIRHITPITIDENKRKCKGERNFNAHDKDNLKEILLAFNQANAIMFSLESLLDRRDAFRVNDSDVIAIIEKLSVLYKKDESVYTLMLDFIANCFNRSNICYRFEKFILSFFIKTDTEPQGFYDLYKKKKHIGMGYLAKLSNEKTIVFLSNEYKDGKLSDREILYFRNNLSHHNLELSLKFQERILEQTDYDFEGDILSDKLISEWDLFHSEEIQSNFNLLFDKQKIKAMLIDYFDFAEKKIINWDENHKSLDGYWNNLKSRKRFPKSFIDIIHNALTNFDGIISIEKVNSLLDKELYLMSIIKDFLIENNRQNILIEYKTVHLKLNMKMLNQIKGWCSENIRKADFKNALNTNNRDNYLRCEILWYLRNRIGLEYREAVLLDMLSIDGQMSKQSQNYLGYDYLKKILSKEKMDARIISNLTEGIEYDLIFENHVIYAIDNELTNAYPVISDHIKKKGKDKYYGNRILESFIKKSNDVNLLKKIVEDNIEEGELDSFVWKAISLLLLKKENNYVIEKLQWYRAKDKKNEKELIIIKYLVRANYEDAFDFFNQWIREHKKYNRNTQSYLRSEDWTTHTNPKSVPYLMELIDIYYNNDGYLFDEFVNPIRLVTETLKNIAQNTIADKCLGIIDHLRIGKEKLINRKDIDLYYINDTLNDLQDIYYELKSQPMEFPKIAQKIEDYEFYLV